MATDDGQDDAHAMARHGPVEVHGVSRVRGAVRWIAPMVSGLLRDPAMRPVKVAIAEALRIDPAVSELVAPTQIYAVERSTIPLLPSVEIIGVTSERVGDGPMVRHALSCEITVGSATEDKADGLLDGIVRAVRARLRDAEHSTRPIALASGEGCLCVLGGTRWSISAANASSVIRGAAIAVSVEVSE